MNFYDPDFDITYINSLMKLSEKLGISPLLDKTNERIKHNKVYFFINLALITSGGAFSIYGTVVYFFPLSTSAVLRLLSEVGLSVLNLMTVAVAALNIELWNSFLKLFKFLDDKLNKGSEVKSESRYYIIAEIVVYHLVTFCIFSYDAYIWCSNQDFRLLRFSMFRHFNIYRGVITVLVIFHFASALRGRYKRINTLLVKSNDLHNIIKSFIPRGNLGRVNNLKSIREVTDYYLLLSELVDMFNKLFGWQIFFVTENIILLLLEVSNSFVLSIDRTKNNSDVIHDIRTIFFLAAQSILFIIFHCRVILSCEDVNKESRNTLAVCYKLQETVDPASEERKELIILSEVVSLLKTRTHAAGFYYINRSLLSRVFAYLVSYSIVLVQFNKQQSVRNLRDFRNETYEF